MEANDRKAWFPEEETSSSPVISRTQYLQVVCLEGGGRGGRCSKAAIAKTLKGKKKCLFLLPTSVKLLDRTELVEELLVDQPRHEEELVVGHELVDDWLLQALGLRSAQKEGRDDTQRTTVTEEAEEIKEQL